ncbi:MAG: single-stranded DNA-binding protein [Firmicutes bacterium]|nr:single-stranded DNA-binding protein [Bacillota bacterium]
MELQNPQNQQTEVTKERNNRVLLSGVVASEPIMSHAIFGEGFYELNLAVNRLSNMQDNIPITISENLLKQEKILVGKPLTIHGEFRSYNKLIDGRSKLMLTVFVHEIMHEENTTNPNVIELSGYVCKAPIYRTTPFNREIADILIAVNRSYNKSDYIPTIAWGRNARLAQNLQVGEKIYLSGRIQSREYQKKLDNGQTETRVAFEVSVNKLDTEEFESIFDEDTKFKFIDNESPDIQQLHAEQQ